jgi:hypothetical protein
MVGHPVGIESAGRELNIFRSAGVPPAVLNLLLPVKENPAGEKPALLRRLASAQLH